MGVLAFMFLAAAPVSAQPVIKGVLNNYTYTLPSLPNYGIAVGSIFIFSGTGLANGSTGLQTSYPMHTNLLATTLSVTVNGASTVPILYYVLPNRDCGDSAFGYAGRHGYHHRVEQWTNQCLLPDPGGSERVWSSDLLRDWERICRRIRQLSEFRVALRNAELFR